MTHRPSIWCSKHYFFIISNESFVLASSKPAYDIVDCQTYKVSLKNCFNLLWEATLLPLILWCVSNRWAWFRFAFAVITANFFCILIQAAGARLNPLAVTLLRPDKGWLQPIRQHFLPLSSKSHPPIKCTFEFLHIWKNQTLLRSVFCCSFISISDLFYEPPWGCFYVYKHSIPCKKSIESF